jgi:8-oxo-dGTP pyrophosphatase MutT (NUDIX family)
VAIAGGDETSLECAVRELHEELSSLLPQRYMELGRQRKH